MVRFSIVVSSAALLLCGSNVHADVVQARQYQALALSPLGDRVADVESIDSSDEEKIPGQFLVIRSGADGKIARTIEGCKTCKLDAPAWSASGKELLFLETDESGETHVRILAAGELRTVATFKGLLQGPRWSPDGRSIAVLATMEPKKEIGPASAGARLIGEIGVRPDEQRVAIIPAAGGELRMISPAGHYVFEFDWLPDGSGFVVTSAPGNADENWYVSKLFRVEARSGEMQEILAPATQIGMPRVSPDGKSVAFIGGLMSDPPLFSGDIYVVPTSGGKVRNVTEGFKGSFTSIAWSGNKLSASATIFRDAAIVNVDPKSGAVTTRWSRSADVQAWKVGRERSVFSRDGKVMAAVVQDFATAPAIMAGPPGRPRLITHENDHLKRPLSVQDVSWHNDQYDLQGWLVGPDPVKRGVRYPMITVAHGGPAFQWSPRFVWRGWMRALIDNGYFLFFPNPRGSSSQGETFKRADVRDLGGGDWRDILTGVDAAIKAAPIDSARLGITGGSYGGYMTLWAVTQTQRFKAAASVAAGSDLVSYYGQNGISQWIIPYFGGSMYDNPAAYRASSPIEFVKRVKTPTMLVAMERDIEAPAVQSLEFWRALRELGVPTRLIIYEGEGHGLTKPEHVRDYTRRLVDWFNSYLGPENNATIAQ